MRGGGLGGEGSIAPIGASATIGMSDGEGICLRSCENAFVSQVDIWHYVQVLLAFPASSFIFGRYDQSEDRCMDYSPSIRPNRFLSS